MPEQIKCPHCFQMNSTDTDKCKSCEAFVGVSPGEEASEAQDFPMGSKERSLNVGGDKVPEKMSATANKPPPPPEKSVPPPPPDQKSSSTPQPKKPPAVDKSSASSPKPLSPGEAASGPPPPEKSVPPPPPIQGTGHTAPGMGVAEKKPSNTWLVVVVAVVIFLALGSATVYFLFFRDSPEVVLEEITDVADRLAQGQTSSETNEQGEVAEPGIEDTRESESEESDPAPKPGPEPTPPENLEPPPPANDPNDTDPDPNYGTVSWDGGEYTGDLKDGLPHGQGTWTDSTGKTYTGAFLDGSITGYGTMIFPGGEVYVGYFKDGKGHGTGTMTHPDGRKVSGNWVDGIYQED